MDGTAIVLQARMGSKRLPGKALADLGGQPILRICIERLKASGLMVVLATTSKPEDDCLEDIARRMGVIVVRGESDDVLARYAQVVTTLALSDVIRATADNPAVDIDAPRRVLDLRQATGVDHVVEHGLPYGCAVEAVSGEAILRAAALTADEYDREHVTPFIKRDARFVALDALSPGHVRHPELRFTVDTTDDLDYMRRLLRAAGRAERPEPIPLAELISTALTLSHHAHDDSGSGRREAR